MAGSEAYDIPEKAQRAICVSAERRLKEAQFDSNYL